MSLKNLVISYLESEPQFRERKNKDRGMVNLLMRKYGGLERAIKGGLITKEQLTAIVQDYASLDRQWRQALELHPNLRGKDYDEKDHLEAKKLEELGYRTPTHVGPAPATSPQTKLL